VNYCRHSELERLKQYALVRFWESLCPLETRFCKGYWGGWVEWLFANTSPQFVVSFLFQTKTFPPLADLLKQKQKKKRATSPSLSYSWWDESHFDNMASFFIGNGFESVIDQHDYTHPAFYWAVGVFRWGLYWIRHQPAVRNTKQSHKRVMPIFQDCWYLPPVPSFTALYEHFLAIRSNYELDHPPDQTKIPNIVPISCQSSTNKIHAGIIWPWLPLWRQFFDKACKVITGRTLIFCNCWFDDLNVLWRCFSAHRAFSDPSVWF